MSETPPSAAFFGFMGACAAVAFSVLGASYGTARAAVGVSAVGVLRPDQVMKNLVPVIMAGVLGIYGVIIAILIIIASTFTSYSYRTCFVC